MKRPGTDRWRALAARARAAPLPALAVRLGYRRDPRRRDRWRRPGSVLAIDGSRFFDHRAGRGGGGAIDLVMHARGCGFRAAVEFLAGAPPTARPPAPPPDRPGGRLRMPAEARRHWPRARHWLTRARGLDPRLLDRCRRAGRLYADRRANAVFVCHDLRGAVRGAEIVGTRPGSRPFRAMAPGSRKARGGFRLPPRARPPDALLLVESAIDALSARQLPAPGLPPHTLIASAAGLATRLPLYLRSFRNRTVLCGFDADPPGDLAARALARSLPRCRRLRPRCAKDWNDLLRRTPR